MLRTDGHGGQCVILVGGLGSRLGPLTADCPKPLLPVAGKPFLAYLMENVRRHGFNDFILLAGYKGELVQTFADSDWIRRLQCRVRVLVEAEPAGTGGALVLAQEHLQPAFLLLNGDSLFDFNLLDLTRRPLDAGTDAWLSLRPVANAARYGTVELHGDRLVAFRERPASDEAALVNGGVYWLSRGLVEALPDRGPVSLERDVLPGLASRGRVGGQTYDGFFLDIGVPEDFAVAQTAIPEAMQRPAIFLDRDGVLNHDHQGYTHRIADFQWIDGARETIRLLNDRGWLVFVVTNQAGIARGYYDAGAVERLHAWMNEDLKSLGGHIDDFRYCPHHPEGVVDGLAITCQCRKPAPGMIEDLLMYWPVRREASLLVGDKESDLQAARQAGIDGLHFQGGNLLHFVETNVLGA